MNNPYGRPANRLDLAAIRTWNRRNAAARREYTLHPFTYCGHEGRCARWAA